MTKRLPGNVRFRRAATGWLALTALALPLAAAAQTVPTGFVDELVAGGLDRPTALAFAPDGRLFVTEQAGKVRIVTSGTLQATPFVSLAVDAEGERGLLGIAFHPNFAANGYLYLYHTVPGSPPHNRVTRFTADGGIAAPGSALPVLVLDNLSNARNHNGGAIHFGKDGKLYVAVGENAQPANAQSLANRLGKILRVNDDGSIPADNPSTFPGIAGSTADANRAIWAVGLRNPYTFAFQPHTGAMMINEVGARTFEEVNVGLAGRNYGWPLSEGPTTIAGLTGPIYAYAHDTGTPTGCAVTGGTFYNPRRASFPASYLGKYFFADYCGGWIYVLDPANPGTATPFLTGADGLIDMVVDTEGALYHVQRGNGQVRRISYTGEAVQRILVATTEIEIAEGASATVGVRLATPPTAPVTLTVTRYLSDRLILSSPASLTFTPNDWSIAQNLGITVAQDIDKLDEGARLSLTTAGLAPALIWITAVDDDRQADAPRAVITVPRNGDTVEGANAEFFGDGLDDVKAVRAEFLIDNVLRYTDVNSSSHFHIGGDHNRWNTTTLANGVHLVELRVFDQAGLIGRHSIRVNIDN